jgi:predicted esterase
MREQPGFAAAAALYASFTAPVDPATLTADSVLLVDLATAERIPVQLKYFAQATLFLPAATVAALPLYGYPLRAGHPHALVLTDQIHDATGRAIGADAAMQDALHGRGDAAAATAPFVAFAATHAGYERAVLAAVFTVQDPAATMRKLRAAVFATAAPAPQGLSCSSASGYDVCTGTFAVPNFQTGTPPYLAAGGRLALDASGAPLVQRTESVRFGLTLPQIAAPSGGFPAVLYEHGTGGDYRSFIREGIAGALASRGIAALSMDQVLHGPRNPGCDYTQPGPSYDACVGTAYFNFVNPFAGRDNTRQGAADGFQLLRLAQILQVGSVRLDSTRLAFLGHSQGGLTGAPFVSAAPELKAAVLSGTGGVISITVLQRKDPLDFKALAELLLGVDGKEPLEPFHPALALIQTFAEPADPISYASALAQQKSVMLTEGLLDPYTTADASEALGAAALFDLGGAAAHRSAAFAAHGLHVVPLPREVAAGTGLLLQYPDQGHFAIFDSPIARCRWLGFLDTALHGATARVDLCGG